MKSYGIKQFLSRVIVTAFLITTWDIPTYYGKPQKFNTTEQGRKKQYVVTEEEIQDTYFIPHQQQYPVTPQYAVPVITPVVSPPEPQPEAKKPKEKHGSAHKEKHVLFQPKKTGNENDNYARISKGTAAKNGNSIDSNRNRGTKKDSGDGEILENSDTTRKESGSAGLIKTTSSDTKKGKEYRNVGCYKDTLPRAVPSLEGSDPILKEYYKRRLNAVEKCSQVAKSRGYQLFTIQNGGFCSSGPMAHRTFQIYGPASNCRNGRGGNWASDVYVFSAYEYELTVHTGTEQKSSTDAKISVALYGVMGSSRHIPLRSQASAGINDPFQNGQVDKFTVHTVPLGDLTRLHVCLDNTGPAPAWYLEKISIKDPRNDIYIFPCNCWLKGGKKGSITERNLLPAVVIIPKSFNFIGCFKHPRTDNIALEAQGYKILDGQPSSAIQSKRTKPINKDYVIEMCAQGTHDRGYMFFGIHNGNQCITSGTFQDTYGKYGMASDCFKTGRGGSESIAVYTFTDREPLKHATGTTS
ncbi:uncharacterized protein LOC114518796 [Dendronephthya gigantea]|uniref:uncharacterized protein LOC114518796 n=1 Tax=Dendronephthya gigantea TaxID=151771 RepID=UPI00106C95E9|nr:uncharacterized protein LOC114518796 [Dendronephthya gigantea]